MSCSAFAANNDETREQVRVHTTNDTVSFSPDRLPGISQFLCRGRDCQSVRPFFIARDF